MTTANFENAFANGRIYRHPLLQMRACRRSDGWQNRTRVAFVAPKKLGPATLRNRTRRRLSECFRLRDSPAKIADYDLIFLATAEAVEAPFQELNGAFDQLLNRLCRDIR